MSKSDIGVSGSLYGHCVVTGCTNGYTGHNGLKKWMNTECSVHIGSNHNVGTCVCPPPFVLWTFPKDQDLKKRWILMIRRKDWEPTRYYIYLWLL